MASGSLSMFLIATFCVSRFFFPRLFTYSTFVLLSRCSFCYALYISLSVLLCNLLLLSRNFLSLSFHLVFNIFLPRRFVPLPGHQPSAYFNHPSPCFSSKPYSARVVTTERVLRDVLLSLMRVSVSWVHWTFSSLNSP